MSSEEKKGLLLSCGLPLSDARSEREAESGEFAGGECVSAELGQTVSGVGTAVVFCISFRGEILDPLVTLTEFSLGLITFRDSTAIC